MVVKNQWILCTFYRIISHTYWNAYPYAKGQADKKGSHPDSPPPPKGDGKSSGLLLEHILAYAAERADEIIRQISERYTRCEIVIRITFGLIINPATNRANPNFHQKSLL